jgi:tetratricopeptide (TPR) repeat protein
MAESAHPLVLRAREAFARSEIKTAELAVEERLRMAGRDINALEVRYLIQKHRGQLGEAARTLDSIIGINARADWAHNALIQLLMAHGKATDAEQVARTALRTNPNNAQAHGIFGSILSDARNLPAGEWHLRRAVELCKPPHASTLAQLADNLRRQGHLEEAADCFARAHELAPDDVRTLESWSVLCEARGELTRAGELIDRAAALTSAEDVSLLRSNHLARVGRYEEALATLNTAKTLTGAGQLARGRLHEHLGHFEEAWQDFVAGKRKLATETGSAPYKADAVEALFARFKQFFTRENMERMPRARRRADVAQPIFIMGPPRAGAALVEQIVCGHSDVGAGGEIPFLAELRKVAADLMPSQQPFPEDLAHSWTADRRYIATVLRDYYLARAESYGLLENRKAFFTDKMPFNEVYLPLLEMAFPQVKIVHVVRHPLDICISMMSSHVTHGFHCGYRIEDIAHHLAAAFDLFEHYRRELDPGDYVLRYESLVADPAEQTRKLLAYLGLAREERCPPSHEQRRQTPASGAARVPAEINDHALNRHRHYSQHLRPYVSRLQPIMAAYGYS